MAGDIEGLKPKLQHRRFCNMGVFEQRHIPVINSWSAEKANRRKEQKPRLSKVVVCRIPVSPSVAVTVAPAIAATAGIIDRA
jgi:hypothetical protein